MAVLGEDEVGGAVGGDDLEAGEATVAAGLPPALVEGPRTGPPGDRLRRPPAIASVAGMPLSSPRPLTCTARPSASVSSAGCAAGRHDGR